MRIAISSAHVGGAGGVERAVYSVATTLDDDEVTVFAHRHLGGKLMEFGGHVQLAPHWRFSPLVPGGSSLARGANRAMRSVQRAANGTYDLLLHYGADSTARPYLSARVNGLILAGAQPNNVNPHFDYLIAEAPLAEQSADPARRLLVLPPPVFPVSDRSELPRGVPSEFILTVMNPYGSVKGADILSEFVPSSPLPVVWCMSNQTIPSVHENIDIPDGVHVVLNPTQGQLRALYEKCSAYVSFSRDEGFGWAIADAYQYGAPIVSRQVGVLRLEELDLASVAFYEDPSTIAGLVERIAGHRVDRELGILAPASFKQRIIDLAARFPA